MPATNHNQAEQQQSNLISRPQSHDAHHHRKRHRQQQELPSPPNYQTNTRSLIDQNQRQRIQTLARTHQPQPAPTPPSQQRPAPQRTRHKTQPAQRPQTYPETATDPPTKTRLHKRQYITHRRINRQLPVNSQRRHDRNQQPPRQEITNIKNKQIHATRRSRP